MTRSIFEGPACFVVLWPGVLWQSAEARSPQDEEGPRPTVRLFLAERFPSSAGIRFHPGGWGTELNDRVTTCFAHVVVKVRARRKTFRPFASSGLLQCPDNLGERVWRCLRT